MKTIALYGGSFDPPHKAHEEIVKALVDFDGIERVILMPAFLNPFKDKYYASAGLRLKWLREIFSKFKNVEISTYEIEKNRAVKSIETVKYLLKKYEKIYLVIGADNLKTLHKWSNYDELKSLVDFIICSRNDIYIPDSFLKIEIDNNISSSLLRENMQEIELSSKCKKDIVKYYKDNNAR